MRKKTIEKHRRNAIRRENTTVVLASCYITVDDDWHPCCPGGQVELTWLRGCFYSRAFAETIQPVAYRVSCWGADDFGMEFHSPDKETAHRVYLDLVALQPINAAYLKSIGFTHG